MQQLGLPYDGIRHVLELFMKSSSFTRYLIDDVLPKEIFNNRKIIEEELDKVLEECESLMVSLKTFKQLSRFLNFGDTVTISSQNIEKKSINDNGLVPVKLVESFQIMDGMLKFTKDFKQFQLYYCELCDDSSYLTNNCKEHFISERHRTALSSTSNSFSMRQCKFCGLFIMATQSLLKSIMDAELHFTIDKTFENLKLKSDDINTNASNKPKEYNSQLSNDVEDTTVASENSDSLVSESIKRSDEGAEGGISDEKENEICSNNDVNNTKISNFYRSKWSMTDVFVEINDKMLNRKIKYCHYCRPCNQASTTAEQWYFHKQGQEHIKNTKSYRNYQEKCFNCSFHIFGRKPALNAYLRYHKEINHKKNNNSDQFGSKDNISNNKKTEKSTERNYSSSWKNSSYFNRKNENVKNNTKHKQISEDISNLEDEEEEIDEPETLLNKTYEVKQKVTVPKKNYASLSLYREVIAHQRKVYLETKFNPPIGACLPCYDIIKDEYDWIAHVKGFHTVNIAFVEDTCQKCKISIYGPLEVITKEIWDTEDHHELDKLITSNEILPPIFV